MGGPEKAPFNWLKGMEKILTPVVDSTWNWKLSFQALHCLWLEGWISLEIRLCLPRNLSVPCQYQLYTLIFEKMVFMINTENVANHNTTNCLMGVFCIFRNG